MSQQNTSSFDYQIWIKESRAAAADLIKHTTTLRRKLFASGDLSPFLSVLIRLHQYDYRNLLLILEQYPSATQLGTFKNWQSLLPSGQVLQNKWKGKSIDLLAPFTEKSSSGIHFLTWYRVTQYDISQTNVTDYPKEKSPYVLDQLHLPYLTQSLLAVLYHHFQRKVKYLPRSSSILQTSLSFYITDQHVVMRSDSTPIQRLQILSEAMSRLNIAERSSLSNKYQVLFSQCVCHCLFAIWLLPGYFKPPTASSIISTFPESQQAQFLDLLQRSVRLLNESATCCYLCLRQSDEYISDLDSDILSHLYH